LAARFSDAERYFLSEASVYRLLKAHDLTSPAFIVMNAAHEYKNKTAAPKQFWQTEFTYLKVTSVFLRECVLRGDGIGLLPSYSVRKDLARGLLKPILTGYKTPELPLFIVYPARQHLAMKVRLCIDFLTDWIRRLSA